MGFLSRELRGLSIAINIAAAGMVAIFVYIGVQLFVWDSEETKIWAGLEALSEASSEKRPFSEFEFICFTAGGFRAEIVEAGRRLGHDIFRRGECGKHSSCCTLNSDGGGIIATVRDGAVHCKQTDKFSFVIPKDRSFCARPDMLVVRKRIYPEAFVIDEKTPLAAWRRARFNLIAPCLSNTPDTNNRCRRWAAAAESSYPRTSRRRISCR